MLKSSKNQAVAVAALLFLDSMKIDGVSSFKLRRFNMYIQDQLNPVNRGDLIKVNGDISNFVSKLEAVVRGILNVTLIGKRYGEDLREAVVREILNVTLIGKHYSEDLREVLLQVMIDNENVNTSCETLSRNISNEALSMVLKKQFMLKWIEIRDRLYVRTYGQILKRVSVKFKKTKISKTADPAM